MRYFEQVKDARTLIVVPSVGGIARVPSAAFSGHVIIEFPRRGKFVQFHKNARRSRVQSVVRVGHGGSAEFPVKCNLPSRGQHQEARETVGADRKNSAIASCAELRGSKN